MSGYKRLLGFAHVYTDSCVLVLIGMGGLDIFPVAQNPTMPDEVRSALTAYEIS
jgi:hypothetical protein